MKTASFSDVMDAFEAKDAIARLELAFATELRDTLKRNITQRDILNYALIKLAGLDKPKPEVFRFKVEGRLPAKKNKYRIRMSEEMQRVWAQLPFKSVGKHIWPGPAVDVKNFEEHVGWASSQVIKKELLGRLRITLWFRGRLDCDNVPGAILDGMEKAKAFKNDKQVKELHLYELEEKGPPEVTIEVEEMA